MSSFRNKVFYSFLFISLLAFILPIAYMRFTMQEEILAEAKSKAILQARFAASFMDIEKIEDWQKGGELAEVLSTLKKSNARFTLINPAGNVIFDSQAEKNGLVDDLDNHHDRPEVRAALEGNGEGFSIRHSNTLDRKLIYAAVRMQDGSVLRVAAPFTDVDQYFSERFQGFLLAAAVFVLLLAVFSAIFTYRIRHSLDWMLDDIGAIVSGNYKRRMRRLPGKEFTAMADGIHAMAASIEEKMFVLEDQNNQLGAIFNTMDDGLLLLNLNGRIRSSNKALQKHFPKLASITSEDNKILIEGIASPELQKEVDRLLGKGEARKNIRIELPKGRMWSVRMSFVKHLEVAEAGSVCSVEKHGLRSGWRNKVISHLTFGCYDVGAVLVFTDITEITKLERMRKDFVANVSHELRTPLSAIQGYAETLSRLETMEFGDSKRFAGIIEKNAARLGRLVEELLILSRLENEIGQRELFFCDPILAAHDVFVIFDKVLEEKKLNLNIEIEPEIEVAASNDHLTQIFSNLLENAVRYASKNSVIELKGEVHGKNMFFCMHDHGPGISPHDIGRIFERFYRADKHRNSDSGVQDSGRSKIHSTGLGLAICKHMVEYNGGKIWAKSPPGEGAFLYFSLPLKRDAKNDTNEHSGE